jgi:hypothetical protein
VSSPILHRLAKVVASTLDFRADDVAEQIERDN